MDRTEVSSHYSAAAGAYEAELSRLRGRSNAVAGLRLLIFAVLVAVVWQLIRVGTTAWILGVLVALGAFIAAVNWYFRLKERRLLWEKLLFVNENEQAILKGENNRFPDGKEYLPGVIYGDDLDVYGPYSIFHALNRTTTLHGTETLAGWLGKTLVSPPEIGRRQEAVRALAVQAERRRLLTARGLLADSPTADLRSLSEWLTSSPKLYHRRWLRILIGVITLINAALLLYALSEGVYAPLVMSIAVSWGITGSFSKYVHRQHLLISHKQAVLGQYADILAVFGSVETDGSPMLEALRGQAREAHGAIRQLGRLTSFFDQRLNILVFSVLNSLGFYDLQCMVALERWKARYRERFSAWIGAVGEIEALNSLATFAFNAPGFVYPVVASPSASPDPAGAGAAPLFIEANDLAHPLIPAKRRIANDVRIGLEEKLILVTGSNMSGKTTFLRTIGVNLLLAQCGSPVCATAFSFTPMQILTSLRISDSLQDQTSYFMAELKKLQQIVASLETGAPTLVLIDEILRGTNSEDKTYGSDHFARKLVGHRCLSLFATHDLALGVLETEMPGVVANYCFESVISEGDLRFDYRLQRGIARNKNASFLMKKMGII